jgi:gamma-glutamylcyclotransferase (GGCT)/AIG2-like uncharacterized protein YtfP
MDVFVYGTLTDHATTGAILDEYEYRGAAELVGLHRVDGRYPTLAPGGTTAGRILATPEIAALDAYEGVDRGLYCRLPIPVADGGDTVQLYVGDPAALNAPVDWPGDGPFSARVERFCDRNGVTVRRSTE